MIRFMKRISRKKGLAPGALIHIGERKIEKVGISMMKYTADHVNEISVQDIRQCGPLKENDSITWINVNGIHQADLIETIGKIYDIHALTLEDIMNTAHRPKVEDFDTYVFLVIKMLQWDKPSDEIKSEQISLVVGHNYLMSFQENEGDVFGPLRDRIRKGKGRIRKLGSDYLAYSIMDAVVDHYFSILEIMGEKIEYLEDEILTNPSPEMLQHLHNMKGEMIYLRKQVWPLREIVNTLIRGDHPMMSENIHMYFRDVYDHTIHVIDTIESFRDILSGILDIYLSVASHRMNEVMKVLTIIATLFIPMTFVAGVYGMNFRFMPELEWKWGYVFVWCVMIGISGIMLLFFKRKSWL